MKTGKSWTIGAAVTALAFGLVAFTPALSAKTLKVQTSSNAGDYTFEHLKKRWAPALEQMSGGELKIELLPTKSVVPHRETPDAVAMGILDGDLTATAYFAGRDPAFAIMGDLIAGYDTVDEMQTFCMNGGGKEILQKMMDKIQPGKIHVIGCSPYSKEALVAKIPLRGVDDLKGLKIRSPEGLAAEVFRRAGAAPVALPFSEVYTSLEKGIVDAADASAYSNNDSSGMHKIAKFPLYPGIHSMAMIQFTLNKKTWDGLTDAQRAMLETWYIAAYTDVRRVSDLHDKELVARDKAGGDIEVIDWPLAERAKFREIAQGAWEDMAAKSPLAKEAYDTHIAFMKKMGLLK